MNTTTTARTTWTLFDMFCWLLGWAIFWGDIFHEMRRRELGMGSPDLTPPLTEEIDPDEEDDDEEPRPAAGFTDEVMAAIREQGIEQVRLITAHPSPEHASATQVGVKVLCRYCWHAQAEKSDKWPSYRPLYDVEWRDCAHHKRAWQLARDVATLDGVFPTKPYFCDVPKPCDLN